MLYRTSDGIIAKRYVDIIPRCFQVLDIASLTLRHAAGAVISNKKLVYFKKYFIFAAESGEYMNSIDINNTGIKVDVSVFL